MQKTIRYYILAALASVAIFVSCSKDDSGSGLIFSKATLGKYESRIEVPKMQTSGTQFIQHSVKIGTDSVMTYCLEWNPTKNHSRWVAFRFDGKTRALGSGRTNAWADDPQLNYKLGFGAFTGGVRGHICASYDRQYDKEANKQTFYITNMSPMQYDFNGSYWTTFESFVQEKGRDKNFADTLYVVKGGTIDNGKTIGTAKTSDGYSMVIPKYYWMALLRVKGGKYSALGFWMEHKDYGSSPAPQSVLRERALNIDELEAKAGIDFFHNLPDDQESAVEAEDREQIFKDWGL